MGDWRDHAACVGLSHLMYPNANSGPEVDAARAICEACPVIDPCLDHAIDRPELYGIWGGSTEAERRDLLSQLRGAA